MLLLLISARFHLQLQILIGGFLETVSLCYITIVGLTVLPVDPSAIVLLMCSLAVFPSIYQAITSRSRLNSLSGKLHVFKFSASAAIAVLGIALLTWKVMDKLVITAVFTWMQKEFRFYLGRSRASCLNRLEVTPYMGCLCP